MREEGYYWVKSEGRWIIAEYDGYYWQFIGSASLYNDSDFEEIDEKRLTHE